MHITKTTIHPPDQSVFVLTVWVRAAGVDQREREKERERGYTTCESIVNEVMMFFPAVRTRRPANETRSEILVHTTIYTY